MTALILFLKSRLGTRAVTRHAIGCRLRRDWAVLGSGKEQIACIDRGSIDQVRKIQIHAIGRDAEQLIDVARSHEEESNQVAQFLGEFFVPTTYTVEVIDATGQMFAVVGSQPLVSIQDSLFYNEGEISPRAARLSLACRQRIALALEDLRNATGFLVDIIGIGNFAFIEGSDHPVLVDTIPIKPNSGAYLATAEEIDRRLAALLTAG